MNNNLHRAMTGWFDKPGAYVLVDGQFGSTGKGLIAGALAEFFYDRVDMVLSNAGPNSGHTSYYGDEKIVLKQLPTFPVIARKASGWSPIATVLTAGAVIDPAILAKETALYGIRPILNRNAAVIDASDREADVQNVRAVAGTGQGVGPAIIKKLGRGERAVVGQLPDWFDPMFVSGPFMPQPEFRDTVMFLEVSQGYSLGINSGFYPHVTTRECTVSQALSDAGLPPSMFRKSIMSVRTFPIRVGNTEGSSGPCYPDQMETSWDRIGVEPEYTTVTKRVRRVFTWSDIQFKQAVFANAPSVIFCNFVEYLRKDQVDDFVWNHIQRPYLQVAGKFPEATLLGWGPKSSDITVWTP